MSESNDMGGFTLGPQDDGSILFNGVSRLRADVFDLCEPVTIYHLCKNTKVTAKDLAIFKIKRMPFF